jgi:hypothetical protein
MIYNVVLNSTIMRGRMSRTIRITLTGLIWKRGIRINFSFNAVGTLVDKVIAIPAPISVWRQTSLRQRASDGTVV